MGASPTRRTLQPEATGAAPDSLKGHALKADERGRHSALSRRRQAKYLEPRAVRRRAAAPRTRPVRLRGSPRGDRTPMSHISSASTRCSCCVAIRARQKSTKAARSASRVGGLYSLSERSRDCRRVFSGSAADLQQPWDSAPLSAFPSARRSRSTRDVLKIVHDLDRRNVSLRILEPPIDTGGSDAKAI